jgi:hypothetical protein
MEPVQCFALRRSNWIRQLIPVNDVAVESTE